MTAERMIELMAASSPETTMGVIAGSMAGAASRNISPRRPPAVVVRTPGPIRRTAQMRVGVLMSPDGARANVSV